MPEASQQSASEQSIPEQEASNTEQSDGGRTPIPRADTEQGDGGRTSIPRADTEQGDGGRTPIPRVGVVCIILLMVEQVLGKRPLTLAPRWHRRITKLRRNRHLQVKPRTIQSGPKMESRIV
jgi:hypothetical protein